MSKVCSCFSRFLNTADEPMNRSLGGYPEQEPNMMSCVRDGLRSGASAVAREEEETGRMAGLFYCVVHER